VLVIEDHADTRAALASYLTMLGCEVGEAANVRDGSRKLASSEWDLFLSDACLPDGTGFDFSDREGFGSCYAVSMNAHDRSKAEARSTAAGYDSHLQKPINPGEIEEIAAEA
jgi:DNA-binding response OmpR family regulator